MSLFFLLEADGMPMQPVRLAPTTPPARAPAFFTNLRRVIMLVLVILTVYSVFQKWVARATRPLRSATRRPELRNGRIAERAFPLVRNVASVPSGESPDG